MSGTALARQVAFKPQCRGVLPRIVSCRNRSVAAAAEAVPSFVETTANVKPFEDIPGPANLPIIGTLWQYKLGILSVWEYHKTLDKLHAKYGPICRQNLSNNEIIHVFDPEDIRAVFTSDGFTPYIKPLQESVQFYRTKTGISPGLGNVNGEDWLTLRAAVRQLMLRPKEVASFLPLTELAASSMVEKLNSEKVADGTVPNLRDVVGKWLHESAGYIAFDRSLGCMAGGETEAIAQKVLDANREIFILAGLLHFSVPIYRYIRTPKFRRLVKAENFFNNTTNAYVKEAITQAKNLMKEGKLGDQLPFMAYLLSRPEMTLPEIIQTIQSLLSDGLTSTRPTFISCLHNLATNPEAQEKAYQEVKEIVGDAEVVTSQMLGQLSYIKAALKETFRLHPIGTEISRLVQSDMILSNYKIPKGTHLNLCPIVNVRKEEYFPEPNEFRPERWLRGQDSNIHPYIVIPFGHGPRACIGRRFAEQDLQVGIAKVLQKFELRHPDNKPMEFVFHTLLNHKHPVRVQFVPRK